MPDSGNLQLITVDDIAEYTGATYDSAATLLLEQIIDSVIQSAENYCDTEFDLKIRGERTSLGDGIICPRHRINRIYGVFTGENDVALITAPNYISSLSFTYDSLNDYVVSVQGAGTETEFSLGYKLLGSVLTDIDSVSGWSYSTTGLSDYVSGAFGLQIWDGNYTGDANNQFYLKAAMVKVPFTKVTNWLLNCQLTCADGIIVYESGYATLPADLKDALIRFIIQSYADRTVVGSETKKSESIGDYSYTNMTQSELSGGGSSVGPNSLSLKLSYYNILDNYRRPSI